MSTLFQTTQQLIMVEQILETSLERIEEILITYDEEIMADTE
ncbi:MULTISPECIES: hypothetical protein [Bacillus cereus group]|uniref:Uncharacterized protein n=1 Tax=Bacillus cereus (strain G9842) TaxID=405531 RepID=B7IZP5_BACC2|nr:MULTISPECIES: hypothetical protein [Bacillus cereus group]ACK98767.1 hypothetical protein BCG9842_A0052 [Bacillus cereus G9842]MDA1951623.1 hypothetical protein [Bacillus cereus]MDA2417044.1 hypothetical protein [Bacillus cereus]MDR4924534.1 hypothetical protein [Bacillus thuringiensis]MEB9378765.1 hypothetical protein [Bacillus cereus]